jgi:hypothetical protein
MTSLRLHANFKICDFENQQTAHFEIFKSQKMVSLDLAIERLFGAKSLRTAKPRSN